MLNKRIWLFWLLFQLNCNLLGTIYIYPVAADQKTIFYICQKSLADLELWRLFLSDNKTEDKHIEKSLYWRFIPAGFTLLPNQKGFSFIDSGRLWIKDFAKRSPKAIDFNMPVFNICEVRWINDQLCYFSAKQNQHANILLGDLHKQQLKILRDDPDAECISPKIIDSKLWYIERHKHDRSCVIVRLDLDQQYQVISSNSSKSVALDCGYQQVIYLEMCTSQLGFYIEHMPYISDNQTEVTLICHKIELVNNVWLITRLFKYRLPKKYLFGKASAYESIMPFLPRAEKTRIYFSDIKQDEAGKYYSELFEFDLINLKSMAILKSKPDSIFFAPLKKNEQIFYGKILEGSKDFDWQNLQIGQIKV